MTCENSTFSIHCGQCPWTIPCPIDPDDIAAHDQLAEIIRDHSMTHIATALLAEDGHTYLDNPEDVKNIPDILQRLRAEMSS